ncbi:histidine kinase [Paenibacillus sp. FSL R10-2734]|uniref:sensor histidine kinase n=1 Tax=Paenibacillus sp. FSL R10-2734 TaxID=2954691 RepID=UPI0030DD661D
MAKLFKKNSLFTKISIYYAVILLCSSMVIIYFTTKQVSKEVTGLNISLQNNILDQVSESLDDLYDDLNNLTKVLAYEGNLENPFYSFLNTTNETDKALQMNYDFSRFFLNFNSSRYQISSILLLNNVSDTPYFWGANNIGRVNGYHFADQNWYKAIKQNERQITIMDTNIPDYLDNFNTNKYMITFARNIYDIQKIRDLRDIGTIIVNLQTETFQHIFESYTKDFKGDFYIFGEDGSIIYDYKNRYTGQKPDSFTDLANTLTQERGHQFVNWERGKYISYTTVPSFKWKLVTVIPHSQLTNGISKINLTIIITVMIAIVCLMLTLLLISRGFFKRLNLVLKAIHRIEEGNFIPVIPFKQQDEIGQLASSIDIMRLRLKDFIDTSYISSIRRQEAELKALQMQVNPHFLYNTLESIRMKAALNQDTDVAHMIKILADLFRWNVKEMNAVISLEEEIEFISTYLDIQKIRFGQQLTYTIDIPPDILSFGILKLMLQPIVENSFIHGFRNSSGSCSIHIQAERMEDCLLIRISDNGSGMPPDQIALLNHQLRRQSNLEREPSNAVGISNVHERICLLFGFDSIYGLQISSNAHGGITVAACFPAKHILEMRQYVKNDHSR